MRTSRKVILGVAVSLGIGFAGLPAGAANAASVHAGKSARAAPAVVGDPIHAEEIRFRNGTVDLAGTLLLPVGPMPHPAILFLPGSGPHTRELARGIAEAFTSAGLAVLLYDKRGNGGSGGDWTRSSLEDLARDGLAGMGYLASRREIDPSRIGVWAPSQGAWVATVLSTLTDDIAFLLVMSGGGVTPREAETYSYERALEHRGVDDVAKRQARALLDAYFAYLGTGEGRAHLVKSLDAAGSLPWYDTLQLERVLPSEANRPNWEWVALYDPLPAIARLRVPVLLLFGAEDDEQPTDRAVARWQEGLRRAGNDRWTVKVFPDAGHEIRSRQADPASGPERPTDADGSAHTKPNGAADPDSADHHLPSAGGFLETATSWLRIQVGLDAPV